MELSMAIVIPPQPSPFRFTGYRSKALRTYATAQMRKYVLLNRTAVETLYFDLGWVDVTAVDHFLRRNIRGLVASDIRTIRFRDAFFVLGVLFVLAGTLPAIVLSGVVSAAVDGAKVV